MNTEETYLKVLEYLELLDFDLINGCFEIRTLKGSIQNMIGFYDDLEKAAKDITIINGKTNIYVAPNTRDRLGVGISEFAIDNMLKPAIKNGGGKNENVLKVNWFIIDIDTKKTCTEKECMATEAEIANSKLVAENVLELLSSKGIDPIVGFSGNGWHILVKTIDYPITVSAEFSKILKYLAKTFNNEFADVDIKLSDPNRILKCYGTIAMKGDNMAERPHRMAMLKFIPEGVK